VSVARTVLVPCLTAVILTLPFAGASRAMADTVYPLPPSSTAIQDALRYLRGQQGNDGSIGTYSDSAWACIAIAAAGEDPHDWKNGGPSLVDYLKEGPPDPFDEFNMGTFLSRMVLAAVAANEDPSAFGRWSGSDAGVEIEDGDYLSALKSLHDGTQFLQDLTGDPDSANTLNEDFWAVRALIAAGESPNSPIIDSTLDHIIDFQETDGGWTWGTPEHSWYEAGSSDVDNTAAAIVALCLGTRGASDAVQNALTYLQMNQHVSGGFESIWLGVNVQSTAWAVDAIRAAGGNPVGSEWTPVSMHPIDNLLAAQDGDGSFGESIRSSADAVAVLVGSGYPPGSADETSASGTARLGIETASLLPWLVLAGIVGLIVLIARRRFSRGA